MNIVRDDIRNIAIIAHVDLSLIHILCALSKETLFYRRGAVLHGDFIMIWL